MRKKCRPCTETQLATFNYGLSSSTRNDFLQLEKVSGNSDSRGVRDANLLFVLSSTDSVEKRRFRIAGLLVKRPLAAVALLPQPLVLFSAGALAGAIGKTITAPLDRVKLLLQTQGGFAQGGLRVAAKKGNVIEALLAIGRQEGFRGYWKGNLPQVLKVIPYSATQLYAYESFKAIFSAKDGSIGVSGRLAAGASAGMTATLITYPLDTLRLRMAVDPTAGTLRGAAKILLKEGSYRAFFRGLGPSLLGIAPYMAMELCIFDLMPKDLPSFSRGFTAALIATTVCYPLDTIRRHIQLQSTGGLAVGQMAHKILQTEGITGFYRGFVPSAVKNLPNKGLRLATFDGAKRLLVTSKAALEEEEQLSTNKLQLIKFD